MLSTTLIINNSRKKTKKIKLLYTDLDMNFEISKPRIGVIIKGIGSGVLNQ